MKKSNTSIFVKIWLSVGVLIIGYVISMIMVQATGGKIKNQLGVISGSLFPAAGLSREAVGHFERQLKFYEDAVLLGEAEMVQSASLASKEVRTSLKNLLNLGRLSEDRIKEIQRLDASIESFSRNSETVYREMASGDMDPALLEKAATLSQENERLVAAVSALAAGLSEDSNQEINSIVDYYNRQQTFNFILFMIVLSISLIIVWLVTKRSIVFPVTRAIDQLKRVAPEIDMASARIAENSQALAQGSSHQAGSIEETSSSLEEMSSVTRQNAKNTLEVNNLMKQAKTIIYDANHSMTELTGSMSEISRAGEETSKL
jgi:hypothetical protein